ncbi:MAG: endonuclease VII domain-containing protein [Alphaproteobacteria bacterium]|nr:endonuclease VII domain-containing protein [Alphaproteobacteria bacterium]
MKKMPIGKRFVKGFSGNPNGRPKKFLNEKDQRYYWNYGIRLAEYNEMLASQDGKCGICGKTETGGRIFASGKAGFAIDHKHVDGYSKMPPEEKRKYVRGLLCVACNNRVLSLLEDVDLVRKAEKYLEKYR